MLGTCQGTSCSYKVQETGNKEAIVAVLDKLIKNHEDWLFLDYPSNPEWVSYSAVMSIKNRALTLYRGYENQELEIRKM